VVLGEVVGVFGIRGEVRLHLHHRESLLLHEGRDATLVAPSGERRPVHIRTRSGAGQRVLGAIDGVDTPEAAASLHGWHVVVDRATLPEPAADEFYVHDLLGLAVVDAAGASLGEIVDVVQGDRDVWVVRTGTGDAFVVATPENVVEVDLDVGRVVVSVGALDEG
jgi:16S rRNA processing protein RimM